MNLYNTIYKQLCIVIALLFVTIGNSSAIGVVMPESELVTGERYEEFKKKWLGPFRKESYYSDSEVERHRSNRGLVNLHNVFVPKGQWVVGSTGSFSNHDNTDYSLAIINDINSQGYGLKVSPLFGYAVADNIVVGARFDYGRSLLRIDEARLSIAGADLALEDLYSITQSYSFAATLRQYIPIGTSQRFALFTEVRLDAGFKRSKMAYDTPVVGNFSKGHSVGLNITPGVVAFATNNVALELTVGFMGVGYSYTEQIQNQVYYGEIDTTNFGLSLNIFSLGVGISFYL
ncbi:MAG: hypothetical protein SNI42_02875 [Rikenellaceae bacterium]